MVWRDHGMDGSKVHAKYLQRTSTPVHLVHSLQHMSRRAIYSPLYRVFAYTL